MPIEMSPDLKNENSIDNGKNSKHFNKPRAKEKKNATLKSHKSHTARENLLLKALSKQKKISQAWCGELQETNLSLQKTNEKLHHYKLASKGHFDLAVEAEVSRRMKELCQPLGKVVQLNLNNVFCMLESLTEMKTLVGSLNRSTHLSKPSSIAAMHTHASNQKTNVKRRPHVVHPMVKGLVLHPAKINIPRVTMRGQQSCILLNASQKRKKPSCDAPINERRASISEPMEPYDSSEVEELTLNNSRKRQKRDVESESSEIFQDKTSKDCDPKSSTEGNSCDDNVNEKKTVVCSIIREDPLEGPSWLYNGGKRKIGQNRKVIIDRIKKGTKAPLEYRVYIDSSSDTESEDKHTSKKPRKNRMKREPKAKKSSEQQPPVRRVNRRKKIVCTKCPQTHVTKMNTTNGIDVERSQFLRNDVGESVLPVPRDCSVVLKREQDNFGAAIRASDNESPPLDKENIPPVSEPTVELNVEEVKLRNIAVVIEDIMHLHGIDFEKLKAKANKVVAKKGCKINGKISPKIARVHNRKIVRSTVVGKSTRRKFNFGSKAGKNKISKKVDKKIIKSSKAATSSQTDSLCLPVVIDNTESPNNLKQEDVITFQETDPLAMDDPLLV